MKTLQQNSFSVFRKMTDGPAVALHGQVFTRPHIVEFILDLAGYTSDKQLYRTSLLEPGCGNGAFVIAAAKRLLVATKGELSVSAHSSCILGIEKNAELVEEARVALRDLLLANGVSKRTARQISRQWVICSDFLDAELTNRFDFIVGNPPYVRQEAIPKQLVERYRARFSCFFDRADLYVAFFERSLELLSNYGRLAFICPNRFTRNNYGRRLRELITEQFKLTHVVDLPEASPFEPEVASYPGIYVVQRGKTEAVDHVLMNNATIDECQQARVALDGHNNARPRESVVHHRYESWFPGDEKWAVHSPDHLSLLRRIEGNGVSLGSKDSGTIVGIGVATGADSVFIVEREQIDIESELLLPLVTTKDILSGELRWRGTYLINPFDRNMSGKLVDLNDYPKAKRYFENHRCRLESRNVGRRNPNAWYRTIDRIHHDWTHKPMVLIPDIKADNLTIALKDGAYYPHHNLYFVTSNSWDLRLLRAILRSSLARFFVFMYGVKMRQGYYRFQAQYLRRICLPPRLWVKDSLVNKLITAAENNDATQLNRLIARLYRLSQRDADLLHSFDEPSKSGHIDETI